MVAAIEQPAVVGEFLASQPCSISWSRISNCDIASEYKDAHEKSLINSSHIAEILYAALGVMTPFFSAPGFNEKDGPVGGAKLRVVSSLIGVMSRGNGRQKIFRDPQDYGRFLEGLEATGDKFGFELFSFVGMSVKANNSTSYFRSPSSTIRIDAS